MDWWCKSQVRGGGDIVVHWWCGDVPFLGIILFKSYKIMGIIFSHFEEDGSCFVDEFAKVEIVGIFS